MVIVGTMVSVGCVEDVLFVSRSGFVHCDATRVCIVIIHGSVANTEQRIYTLRHVNHGDHAALE